jgi:hypothetical protein
MQIFSSNLFDFHNDFTSLSKLKESILMDSTSVVFLSNLMKLEFQPNVLQSYTATDVKLNYKTTTFLHNFFQDTNISSLNLHPSMASILRNPKPFYTCFSLILLILIITGPLCTCRPIVGSSHEDSSSSLTKETKEAVKEKYKPLLLSTLPRGKPPPSGPSRGTNEKNT